MTASDSFHATIRFSVLALSSLFLGNLASAFLSGDSAAAWGVLASLLAIGTAYGCQLVTTAGLQFREDLAGMVDPARAQATNEAVSMAESVSLWFQWASIAASFIAGILLVVSLP
jgi:hypothetical protein